MTGKELKSTKIKPQEVSTAPIVKQDWDEFTEEEIMADDELAIRGERQVESEDAGDLSEDDDDNPYQNSDDALPDDEEEKEISRDLEREGRRFND